MTQDEIFEMARQAKLEDDAFPFDEWEPVELITFAKLIAAAAVTKEREACAKVCDSLFESSEPVSDESGDWVLGTKDCASAIRARQ